MNKEEVKFDHFKDIEELIKHLEMWYAEDDYFAYERYFHLRDARIMGMFIYELQQENKQLKERIIKVLELLIDSDITMGEFKAYYKLLTNKDYEAKKSFEYNIDILKGDSNV